MDSIIQGLSFASRGGFMMIPLLIAGLVSATIIFERLYLLKKKLATPSSLSNEIIQMILASKQTEARQQLLKQGETPVAAVLKRGLDHFGHSRAEIELVDVDGVVGEELVDLRGRRLLR